MFNAPPSGSPLDTKFAIHELSVPCLETSPQRSTPPSPSGHPHRLSSDHSFTRRPTRKRISRMQIRCQSYTRRSATTAKSHHIKHMAVNINTLPDEAVLGIFDFLVHDNDNIEAWRPLVHVCRKWRYIVFGSPRRLNLHLHCTAGKPVKEMLDIWPLFPIIINGSYSPSSRVDNIVAALQHNDRVRDVAFRTTSSSQCETVLAAMQAPFPELTRLCFESKDKKVPVVPDSFLGGSSPRLRSLSLDGILFSDLPKLLLSASELVEVSLSNIPHSGYIAPHAMTTCLSTLTRLNSLSLNFQSPKSRPDPGSWFPRPIARFVLPALTELRFTGVSEYLEDLVDRIDTPLLRVLDIRFFFQLVFETPQLTQFIGRTPQLRTHNEAWVVFSDSGASISLPPRFDGQVELGISCQKIDWQLSSLVQVCGSCFPQALISAVEHLHILEKRFSPHHWDADIESSQWLDLLIPFTTVRHLYLSKGFVPRIMPALQEFVRNRAIRALQSRHLEVPPIWIFPADHWWGVRLCTKVPLTPDNGASMGQSTVYWWARIGIRVLFRIPFGVVCLNNDIYLNTHRLAGVYHTRDIVTR